MNKWRNGQRKMGIKTRVERLEAKKNPELLNVIIRKPRSDRPLPKPHINGGVLVSYRYDDAM